MASIGGYLYHLWNTYPENSWGNLREIRKFVLAASSHCEQNEIHIRYRLDLHVCKPEGE